eukprot:COSAG03_NODE_3177_length_2161_cov_1.516974_2_plen_176_part_00
MRTRIVRWLVRVKPSNYIKMLLYTVGPRVCGHSTDYGCLTRYRCPVLLRKFLRQHNFMQLSNAKHCFVLLLRHPGDVSGTRAQCDAVQCAHQRHEEPPESSFVPGCKVVSMHRCHWRQPSRQALMFRFHIQRLSAMVIPSAVGTMQMSTRSSAWIFAFSCLIDLVSLSVEAGLIT